MCSVEIQKLFVLFYNICTNYSKVPMTSIYVEHMYHFYNLKWFENVIFPLPLAWMSMSASTAFILFCIWHWAGRWKSVCKNLTVII